MPDKLVAISRIHSVMPHAPLILNMPRRSYTELQLALARAEKVTERTLCELLALRQQQQGNNSDIPDKPQMQQQLRLLIKQTQRNGSGFAVLFVQLDHYQDVFQQHGAVVAKQLTELALSRLSDVLRECDIISQQADDQFLLLITDVKRIYDVVLVAEKLLQKLALANGLSLHHSALSASIGISRCPQDGVDARLLTERAAATMLHAQHRGGNQFSLLC